MALILEQRRDRGEDDAQSGQERKDPLHRQVREHLVHPEDIEGEAQHHIHRDLGRGGGQENGYHRGRVGVGVGEPQVQREQGQFQGDADDEEGEGRLHGTLIFRQGQARREIRHVERAGGGIHEADPDQDEGPSQGAHDQVLERRRERPAILAHGDQRIGGQAGDFQEHEHIEGIAGGRHAHQAGHAQQQGGIEQRGVVGADFPQHAHPGIGQQHGGDGAYQEQHGAIQGVDAIDDTQRRGPAAQRVGDWPQGRDPIQQQHGVDQHSPGRGKGDPPGQDFATQQHAQGCGGEGQNHLQDREMGGDHRLLSWR